MTNEELQEKLKELDRERQLESSLANSSRAQSITVGNAGSGSVELTMRSNNGQFFVESLPTRRSNRVDSPAFSKRRL